MDFGLARLMEEDSPDDDERPRTRDAQLYAAGTSGRKVREISPASDVYALERFCITLDRQAAVPGG